MFYYRPLWKEISAVHRLLNNTETADIMSCEDHYKKVLDKVIKICREDRVDYKELANYISGLEDIVIDIRDIKQEYDFF